MYGNFIIGMRFTKRERQHHTDLDAPSCSACSYAPVTQLAS